MSRCLARTSAFVVRSRILPVVARQLHRGRSLEYPIEKGLGDFLTPNGLRTVVDWQDGLLSRLNEEVRDTELEGQSVVQTVISTATQKSNCLAFMYASQALNNSFFLDNLKPPTDKPSHEDDISMDLQQSIARSFGTVNHLKSTMSAAALGMSSSGWVWCVQDASRQLGIVPTFGHGTVLVRSRMQRSPPLFDPVVGENFDPRPLPSASAGSSPTATSPASGTIAPRSPGTPKTLGPKTPGPPARGVTTPAPAYRSGDLVDIIDGPLVLDVSKIGGALSPLFCISLHEHAWISSGYGVWGKEDYLKRFWSVLDWKKVSETSTHWAKSAVG